MKITIDIQDKIVALAVATLKTQADDEESEALVDRAVKAIKEENFVTDLSELEDKAMPMTLSIVMLALVRKIIELEESKDGGEKTPLEPQKPQKSGLAARLESMQQERERIIKEQKKRKS